MLTVDRSPVKRPRYLERLISLGHRASDGNQFAPVGWLVAEREGQYLRSDWKQRLEESSRSEEERVSIRVRRSSYRLQFHSTGGVGMAVKITLTRNGRDRHVSREESILGTDTELGRVKRNGTATMKA